MRRVPRHHHEVAFFVDHVAPANVAAKDIALFVVGVVVSGKNRAGLHANQDGDPACLAVTEQLPDFDAGRAAVEPRAIVRTHVRQRFQGVPVRHAGHQPVPDGLGGRDGQHGRSEQFRKFVQIRLAVPDFTRAH